MTLNSFEYVGPPEWAPHYATEAASGIDLCYIGEQSICLKPMDRVLFPTGTTFNLSPGVEVQIRPRSGLALKHGLTVLNAPGTIDADYTGEAKVLLVNLSNTLYWVKPGDKIAQAVFAEVLRCQKGFTDNTVKRGPAAGFNSTGYASR